MYREWVIDKDTKKISEEKLKAQFKVIFDKLKESGDNEEIEEILNNEETLFKTLGYRIQTIFLPPPPPK